MTAPVRVALLSTFNQRCGLASYAGFLASALRERGVQPLILAERTEDTIGPDGPDVIRCWRRDAGGGQELPDILRAHRIDVLHVNYGSLYLLDGWLTGALARARAAGIRVVTTFHETEAQGSWLGVLARLSDRVLVHGPQNALELVALNGPAERIECVPHGIPRAVVTDPLESKLALGWDPGRKVVGTFGFTDPHKGLLELVDAMPRVHRETAAELRVLGCPHPTNPQSLAYLEACKRRSRELGLEHAIRFADAYLPDDVLLRELRGCDVLAMNYSSPRFETSGAALFALAAGRPIVSSAAPPFDYGEALTFKTTGRFELGTALTILLTNPFVARQLLANQRRYEEVAAWDVVAARIARIYEEVAAAPSQPDTDRLHFYRSHPDSIYAEPLQRERVRWLRSKARGRILEVGAANGYVAEFVGATAAVDVNRRRLEVAAALRPSVRFEYADVVKGLPFSHHEFDVVLAPEILEHVEFDEAVTALRECARVGRSVLLTLPNGDKPDYDPDLVHNIEHRWLVDRTALERLMHEAGCTSYAVEVSEGGDFYLVEVHDRPERGRARFDDRVAILASRAPRRDADLHVLVDGSVLANDDSCASGIARYAFHQFDELSRRRPSWRFTWLGAGTGASSDLARLCSHPNAFRASWDGLGGIAADVVYLPDATSATAARVLEATAASSTFVACTLSDLAQLLLLPRSQGAAGALDEAYVKQLRRLQQRCDLFICGSQRTAQDAQALLHLPLARLRTVHAGASPRHAEQGDEQLDRLLERLGVHRDRYVLAVGGFHPRKNAPAMFLALASARRTLGLDVRLVLTGHIPADVVPALAQIAAQSGLPVDAIVAAGKVTDRELTCLYRAASALLHPSLVGGLGITLLEALGAEIPVIAGNDLAQAEICGDAALVVDPGSVHAIAHAIVRVHADAALRRELAQRAVEQQRRFSWSMTAEKTAVYLAEAVARARAGATGYTGTVLAKASA